MKVKQWVFYIRNRKGFSESLPQLLRHCLEVSIRKIKTNTKGIVKLEEGKEKDVAAILTQLATNKTIDGVALHLPPKAIPAPTGDDVDTSIPYWLCENKITVKFDNSNLSALAKVTSIIDDYVDGRYPWKEFPDAFGNTMCIVIQVRKEDAENLTALLSNAAGKNNVVLDVNKWFKGDRK